MKRPKQSKRTAILHELSFLESLAQRCPQDAEILKALGDLYTQIGWYENGLKVDLELSRLCPQESLVWYNLACSYARLARKNEAFSALTQAVDLGYQDYHWLKEDADLKSIRNDRRFTKLLLQLFKNRALARRSS